MSDQVYAWVVVEGNRDGGPRVPLMTAVPVSRVSKQYVFLAVRSSGFQFRARVARSLFDANPRDALTRYHRRVQRVRDEFNARLQDAESALTWVEGEIESVDAGERRYYPSVTEARR